MASTRLERKAKRNKARAKNRISAIKRLNTVPTIKNVDVEEIKKEFEQAPPKSKKAAEKEKPAKKEEAKKAEPAKAGAKKEEKPTPKAEEKAPEAKADEKAPEAKSDDKEEN